jgi:hypothetical protein
MSPLGEASVAIGKRRAKVRGRAIVAKLGGSDQMRIGDFTSVWSAVVGEAEERGNWPGDRHSKGALTKLGGWVDHAEFRRVECYLWANCTDAQLIS